VRFGFSDEWEWLAELFDMGFLQMDDKGSICSPPLLVYRSTAFMAASESYSSTLFSVGLVGLSISFLLLLPFGVICLILSWRLSIDKEHVTTDAHNLIEFLLGASGLMMISLGSLLSLGGFYTIFSFIE
jgi:hypothetical protein